MTLMAPPLLRPHRRRRSVRRHRLPTMSYGGFHPPFLGRTDAQRQHSNNFLILLEAPYSLPRLGLSPSRLRCQNIRLVQKA